MSEQLTNEGRIDRLERAVRYIALRHTTDGEHSDVLWKVRTLLHTPEEKVPPKPEQHYAWYRKEFPDYLSHPAAARIESFRSWHESRRQAIQDVDDWLRYQGHYEIAERMRTNDWGTSDGDA